MQHADQDAGQITKPANRAERGSGKSAARGDNREPREPRELREPREPHGREKLYSIADMAREFDVTARTLRYYEDQGLLTPRRDGSNRIYTSTDRIRLAWILRGKRVGFSLSDIAEMLALYDLGDGRETQRVVTLQKCRDRIDDLEAQRRDLEATIAELSQFCSLLETVEYDAGERRWIDPKTGRPPATQSHMKAAGLSYSNRHRD